jgi:mono/diheme cytochrome c family protein
MDARIRHGLLILALVVPVGPLLAQAKDSLPEGVTAEMVAKGKKIFGGPGLCMACHGPQGKGLTGPDLTDSTWLHFDGSYQAIVKIVLGGIDDKQSKTGVIMPPKGGSGISDDDVKAVAAYVWSLRKRS